MVRHDTNAAWLMDESAEQRQCLSGPFLSVHKACRRCEGELKGGPHLLHQSPVGRCP